MEKRKAFIIRMPQALKDRLAAEASKMAVPQQSVVMIALDKYLPKNNS